MPARCSWDGPGLHQLIGVLPHRSETDLPIHTKKKFMGWRRRHPAYFMGPEQLCVEGPATKHSSPDRGSTDE